MNKKIKKPELLSPAGDAEKLRAAVRFGADAVYLAGEAFGMRSASKNFSLEELYEAAEFLHSLGKKMYITVNVLPHGGEYPALTEFLREVRGARPDAFIVADLGVIGLLKEEIPEAHIHISTQASITSPAAARAYAALGASRLVLARELSLAEIGEIRAALPDDVELECFVHGSMCVSYSGRCLLSNMMAGRDANHGRCAQPCRWNYTLMEEKRPDERFPIEETPAGTFIMSSKDMCMIEHIPELIDAGIASFKLEGRVKSAYYAAVVTNAYRMAVMPTPPTPTATALTSAGTTSFALSHTANTTRDFIMTAPPTTQSSAAKRAISAKKHTSRLLPTVIYCPHRSCVKPRAARSSASRSAIS